MKIKINPLVWGLGERAGTSFHGMFRVVKSGSCWNATRSTGSGCIWMGPGRKTIIKARLDAEAEYQRLVQEFIDTYLEVEE